jgi:hypothetical protein
VVEEAARLLAGLTFSAGRGGYARGDLVVVNCAPRWIDEETISVLVTCHALAHAAVDWSGLSVWTRYHGDDGRVRLALAPPFDPRGQAYLPELPRGRYVLGIHRRRDVLRPARPAAIPVPEEGLEPRAVAAPQRPTVAQVRADGPQVVRSADGSIVATMQPSTEGLIVILTASPDLAGRIVFVALVDDETGQLLHPEAYIEVPLVPDPDHAQASGGPWSCPVTGSTACKLLFQLIPRESD